MSLAGPLADVAVGDGEQLARFVLFERHLKTGKVKAEALLPYKHVELSVSRHRDLSAAELWALGKDVAAKRSEGEGREIMLIGRADFSANDARKILLDAIPDEPPRNHANIVRWPAEKSAQMSLAQKLAATCRFTPHSPL